MGLDIGVGWLARWRRELDAEQFAEVSQGYDLLNAVLAEAGLPTHHEPLEVAEEDIFDAQMYGYSGLHTVRRLAAYVALKKRLPSGEEREERASQDPLVEQLERQHLSFRPLPPPRPWDGLTRWLDDWRPKKPKFQHLLFHSDCEGFYVPHDFRDVVFDTANPQREGLGAMVGSTQRLLTECQELAGWLKLPEGIDPEDDRLWEVSDSPIEGGEPWQVLGVEAFCLARLLRGCERSLKLGAVLGFY